MSDLIQDTTREALARLSEAYVASTPGKWRKGISTHHTVTDLPNAKNYKVGEFHHADDAHFCDVAHEVVPILLAAIGDAPAVPAGFVLVQRNTAANAWGALSQIMPCAHPDCKLMDSDQVEKTYRELHAALAATPAAVQPEPTSNTAHIRSVPGGAAFLRVAEREGAAVQQGGEALSVFHSAWASAKEMPGYNKEAWKYVQQHVEAAALAPTPQAPQPTDTLDPQIEGRLSVWLTLGKELHPLTVNLVVRFARALAAKLADAEKKYGYSDGWRSEDWMDECRAKLLEHVAKGDPRDVAAYCAFLWHHGESTAVTPATQAEMVATGWAPIGPQGQPDLSEIAWNDEDCHDLAEGWTWKPVSLVAASLLPAQAPAVPQKLWLWKNFVDGRPEYWAFDNPYPINLDNGDPQTLGEPCGYALLKPSRTGRTDVSEEQVLRAIARAPAHSIGEAMHASAPEGCGCADCAIDREACPRCYSAWWAKRHPNVEQLQGESASTSEPAPAEQGEQHGDSN